MRRMEEPDTEGSKGGEEEEEVVDTGAVAGIASEVADAAAAAPPSLADARTAAAAAAGFERRNGEDKVEEECERDQCVRVDVGRDVSVCGREGGWAEVRWSSEGGGEADGEARRHRQERCERGGRAPGWGEEAAATFARAAGDGDMIGDTWTEREKRTPESGTCEPRSDALLPTSSGSALSACACPMAADVVPRWAMPLNLIKRQSIF